MDKKTFIRGIKLYYNYDGYVDINRSFIIVGIPIWFDTTCPRKINSIHNDSFVFIIMLGLFRLYYTRLYMSTNITQVIKF